MEAFNHLLIQVEGDQVGRWQEAIGVVRLASFTASAWSYDCELIRQSEG
jgi:hypothetical protein